MMNRKEYGLMLAVALVAGLVGGVVSGRLFMTDSVMAQGMAQSAKVVTAEEFRLVGKDGQTRAVLGLQADDNPFLFLLGDKDSQGGLVLELSKDGSTSIRIKAKDGKPHFSLVMMPDGRATLALMDSDGKMRTVLDATGGLSLLDKAGHYRGTFNLSEKGVTTLGLRDDTGKQRGAISVHADGSSSLSFSDKDKEVRAIISYLEKEQKAGMLFIENRKTIWSAP